MAAYIGGMDTRPDEAGKAYLASLERALDNPLLDPAYRRRKLILWTIRQSLSIALAWWFWDLWWVRLLFGVVVVLAVFQLVMLLWGGPMLLRRAERARERFFELEAMEAQLADDGDAQDTSNEPDQR
jgi:hypothetical protein